MRERYGDAAQFLELFGVECQTYAARNWMRAYKGVAPILAAVIEGYGQETATVWLCIHLESVNLFAGVRQKMPVERQKELALLICSEYPRLRVSELLLFFHRLKCGRYGRFYGAVDALFITSALLLFMDERRNDLARIAQIEEERKAAAPVVSSTAITYAEHLERKRQREEQELKNKQDPHENDKK